MIQIETTRIIESYLDGTLEKEDICKLEALAKKDKELSDLIQLFREVNKSISDNNFFKLKNKLCEIVNYKPSFFLKRILHLAALIIFILAASITISMYLWHSKTGPELYDKYYIKYDCDIIVRSSANSSDRFNYALMLYQVENYVQSASLLDSIIHKDPLNYLAIFYKGLTYLELHLSCEAIKTFSSIPDDWKSPYAIHRDWYFALSLLDSKKEKQAIGILKKLMDNNTLYSEKSKSILSKIKL